MLCDCGRAFGFFDLEARHYLIDNGVGVVEAEFIDSASCFSELKVSFAEVVLDVHPLLLCGVCTFLRAGVIFEDPLFVQDDKGKVDYLALG